LRWSTKATPREKTPNAGYADVNEDTGRACVEGREDAHPRKEYAEEHRDVDDVDRESPKHAEPGKAPIAGIATSSAGNEVAEHIR
jgi:hypothetical protein